LLLFVIRLLDDDDEHDDGIFCGDGRNALKASATLGCFQQQHISDVVAATPKTVERNFILLLLWYFVWLFCD
jgi:hypothetical protein